MEERYIVSARKYRPITFESVVGQENITKTLRNAIRQQHLAQAYLFCGPRGVGKTTCARIFAKTINCLNPTADHDACNECESCRAFNEQRSFNIHELDAASNNSVEDIRTLIDQVRIPPQIGKYSVYIIDEVHMLSKDAFNALLKTLEEPPSYAIFILATTEKHKVIPTILSRCQIYDFSRITVLDTIHHLQYVAQKEGITVTEEALNVVAQKADGGMRDALSIFDQLVSFCGNNITYEQAIEVLNVLDTEYYFRLVECALSSDVRQALLLLNNVLNKGFDAQNFVVGLGLHLRNLLVSKDAVTVQLLETSDAIRKHYAEQAQRCADRFLFKAMDLANECDIQYRVAKNKRLTVELMLVKLCQLCAPAEQAQPAAPQLQPIAQQPRAVQQPTAAAPQQAATISQPAAGGASVNPTLQAPAPIKAAPASFKHVSLKSAMQAASNAATTTTAPTAPTAATMPMTATPAAATPPPVENTPITDEAFEAVWRDLGKHFGKEDDRLRAALINGEVSRNGANITLVLANSMQEQEVKKHREALLNLLHKGLRNTAVTLQTRVEEARQTGGGTTAERYQHLVAQNKALEDLRQAMDMQLD